MAKESSEDRVARLVAEGYIRTGSLFSTSEKFPLLSNDIKEFVAETVQTAFDCLESELVAIVKQEVLSQTPYSSTENALLKYCYALRVAYGLKEEVRRECGISLPEVIC